MTINASGQVQAKLQSQIEPVDLGQLELAIFANEAGLEAIGNNFLIETPGFGPGDRQHPRQRRLRRAAAGLPRELERQPGAGDDRADHGAAGLRSELQGDHGERRDDGHRDPAALRPRCARPDLRRPAARPGRAQPQPRPRPCRPACRSPQASRRTSWRGAGGRGAPGEAFELRARAAAAAARQPESRARPRSPSRSCATTPAAAASARCWSARSATRSAFVCRRRAGRRA